MAYATASQLMQRFDAAEIAQRADRGVPRVVTAALLADVAAGADLSAYTGEETARATTALAVVQRALQDADDTINSYLSSRYTLPLAPVPAVLERTAAELARYYLFDDQVTDLIKDRYTAAIKFLKDVALGTVALGASADTGAQPTSSASAELVSGGKVWGRATSQGFL
jgi:phage gp36-like protein